MNKNEKNKNKNNVEPQFSSINRTPASSPGVTGTSCTSHIRAVPVREKTAAITETSRRRRKTREQKEKPKKKIVEKRRRRAYATGSHIASEPRCGTLAPPRQSTAQKASETRYKRSLVTQQRQQQRKAPLISAAHASHTHPRLVNRAARKLGSGNHNKRQSKKKNKTRNA